MPKEKFIPLYKRYLKISFYFIFILAIFFFSFNNNSYSTSININPKQNNNISAIPNVFNETTSISTLNNTSISLNNVSIKENEKYQITDFINNSSNIPQEITYTYAEEEMNNYQKAGNYKITILFKDQHNNTLTKDTNLTINAVIKESSSNRSTKNNKTTTNTSKPTTSSPKSSTLDKILNDNKKLGGVGRVYFSSGFTIALYRPTTTAEAQRYVDNKDSGSYYQYENIKIIADHAYQGFTIIKKQNIGDIVYIKRKDDNGNIVVDQYVVIEKTNGYNTGYHLLTVDGRDVGYGQSDEIALYTCNTSDGYSVSIVIIKKI